MKIQQLAPTVGLALLAFATLPHSTHAACASQCSSSVQIIGCDDRVEGPKTAQTAYSAPWRSIGRLVIGNEIGCTGTLIGPKHVLTGAHCLLDLANDFRDGAIQFRLGQFSLGPCGRPYGDHYAVRTFVPFDYDNASATTDNKANDWAVVELANPVPGGVALPISYLSWETVSPLRPFTIGYPGDKPQGTHWETGNANQFLNSPHRWLDGGQKGLFYITNDAVGGQSGSPIYVFHQGVRKVVGVMVGSPVSHCQAGWLWAARLTPNVVQLIENAMDFPNTVDFDLRWHNVDALDRLDDVPPSDGCGFPNGGLPF